MAAILAAFDNVEQAGEVLAGLPGSPFASLLQPGRKPPLLVFGTSDTQLEGLHESFPALKIYQTHRLLDNNEGGVRGALFGILAGVIIIQLVGLALFVAGGSRTVIEAGSGVDLSQAGALIMLFTGFFGAIAGGMIGYLLGRKWIGLPAKMAQRFEQRLAQGQLILALNQRRLLLDRPRRVRLQSSQDQKRTAFPVELFSYWLGEHGAQETRRVAGSVHQLKVTPSLYRHASSDRPFSYYGEASDEEYSSEFE